MKEYIAMDCHKHYSLVEREGVKSRRARQCRIEHERGAIRKALADVEPGTAVAVEAMGYWYWIIEEIEAAGLTPLLVHPRKAKLSMGLVNKTDKLDVHGLNVLQRCGTLPTVWIAPAEVRDQRELTRTRVVMGRLRTDVKNRVHAELEKYALGVRGASDAFGPKAREELLGCIGQLPPWARRVTEMMVGQLDGLSEAIGSLEREIRGRVKETPDMQLMQSLPGIAFILGATVALEVGDIERFPCAERYASYAGKAPTVHSSGGKTYYGPTRSDVNQYLKWAYAEAANSVALNATRLPERHVSRLYLRLRERRGHSKAIGAVGRHLAEATYHVLHRKEPYRDPSLHRGRTREA